MKDVFRAMICLTVICLTAGLRPDTQVVAGFPPQKSRNPDQPQFQENARLVPQVPGDPQRVVAILPGAKFMWSSDIKLWLPDPSYNYPLCGLRFEHKEEK